MIPLSLLVNLVYNSIYIPALLLALLVGYKTLYKYNISKARFFCYFFTLIYGFLSAWLSAKIYMQILRAMEIYTKVNLAVFGAILFTPLCIIATVLIEKGVRTILANRRALNQGAVSKNKTGRTSAPQQYTVSVRNTLDMMTPVLIIVLIFVNFRCAWVGCCYGFQSSWGIFSRVARTTTFPVQLFEAATTFLVLLISYFIKHTKFFRRGMAFPLTAGMYCIPRFFWEYVRYYSPGERDFWHGMTFWQLMCIFVFICSVISVLWLYKTKPSEPLPKKSKSKPLAEESEIPPETQTMPEPQPKPRKRTEPPKQKNQQKPRKQTVSQMKYSKDWQSTKKKYKKKKK